MVFSVTGFAGRPLVVDDAGTVDPDHFELEAGSAYEHAGASDHVDFPLSLTYGVGSAIEVGISGGEQLEHRTVTATHAQTVGDFDDLGLGGKWNPLHADRFWAEHAVACAVTIPVADSHRGMGSGHTDFDLMYLATKTVAQNINVDVNFGFTWVGGDADTWHYGAAARWQANQSIEWVAEVFAQTPTIGLSHTSVAMNAGARWSVTTGLVLDAAAGAGLRGDAADWTATAGLTWTFGPKKNQN